MALSDSNMQLVNNSEDEISDEDSSLNSEILNQDHAVSDTTSSIDVSIFGESNGYADVTLVVEGRNNPVTKAVLGLASPVFRAMFQSDFQEIKAPTIPLPDKELHAFVMFLRCIYPNIIEHVTGKNTDFLYSN